MNNDINKNQNGISGQVPNNQVNGQPVVQPQPVQSIQQAAPVVQPVQPQPVVQPQQVVQSQPVVQPQQNVQTQPAAQQNTAPAQPIQGNQAVSKKSFSADKIVDLIKKNKLIVIGILVLVVVVALFTKGGKSGGVLKKNTSNNSNVTNNEKTEEQKRLEEEALKGTFVIGAYRLKYPEGYTLKDTIDGTIILTDEEEHRIELTLEKYKTVYVKSNTIQSEIADVYSLDGYETINCGLQKINQTSWVIYDGLRDESYKTIAFVEFQSKMLKIQLENDSLEYNKKIIEEFTELIKHVVKK